MLAVQGHSFEESWAQAFPSKDVRDRRPKILDQEADTQPGKETATESVETTLKRRRDDDEGVARAIRNFGTQDSSEINPLEVSFGQTATAVSADAPIPTSALSGRSTRPQSSIAKS